MEEVLPTLCEYCDDNPVALKIRHQKFQEIELFVCRNCFENKKDELGHFEVVEDLQDKNK